MTNPWYNENFVGQAGQTARASDVKNELTAVGTAFDSAYLAWLRTIKGQGGETLNSIPVSGTRALKWLRFDSSGQPEVIAAPFVWRGAWVTATSYVVGDIVTSGAYSSIYICHTAHTSAGSFDGTKFTLMVDFTGINIIRNEIKTASFTAVAGGDYMIDSTGGDVEVTLPAAPSILDAPINITHIAGSLTGAQEIRILRNGLNIMGAADDLEVNSANASFSLMYADASRGWRLRVLA